MPYSHHRSIPDGLHGVFRSEDILLRALPSDGDPPDDLLEVKAQADGMPGEQGGD